MHAHFKIYPLDVGLLGAQSNLAAETIIQESRLFTEFKGALTECYVAQAFMAQRNHELYYWTSSGTAEVDFLIEHAQKVFPLEVKAGSSTKKKSLIVYTKKYTVEVALRSTQRNLKHDGNLINIPLYMVSLIDTILDI